LPRSLGSLPACALFTEAGWQAGLALAGQRVRERSAPARGIFRGLDRRAVPIWPRWAVGSGPKPEARRSTGVPGAPGAQKPYRLEASSRLAPAGRGAGRQHGQGRTVVFLAGPGAGRTRKGLSGRHRCTWLAPTPRGPCIGICVKHLRCRLASARRQDLRGGFVGYWPWRLPQASGSSGQKPCRLELGSRLTLAGEEERAGRPAAGLTLPVSLGGRRRAGGRALMSGGFSVGAGGSGSGS
jgi:hypothetical protein